MVVGQGTGHTITCIVQESKLFNLKAVVFFSLVVMLCYVFFSLTYIIFSGSTITLMRATIPQCSGCIAALR